MKRIFTSLIIAFFTLLAVGAKAQVKSYFGFFGGISIPEGDFAKSDYNNNKAGFAKQGLNWGFDGAYYFYKNLGIGATFAYQDNGELKQADVDKLAAGYTSSFGADGTIVTGNGRYQNISFLLGPQYSIPFGKFILDLRASAGFLKLHSTPGTSILLTGVTDQTSYFYQRSASGTLFAYGANADLRYKLSDNVFITLRGAYVDSQGPTIKNDNRNTNIGRIVTKQPITSLQTTIGLSFGL